MKANSKNKIIFAIVAAIAISICAYILYSVISTENNIKKLDNGASYVVLNTDQNHYDNFKKSPEQYKNVTQELMVKSQTDFVNYLEQKGCTFSDRGGQVFMYKTAKDNGFSFKCEDNDGRYTKICLSFITIDDIIADNKAV